MVFTTLMLFQLFNLFNARSDEETAFRGLLENRWLLAAIALSVLFRCGGLCAVSPTRVFDRIVDDSRLAALHRRREFGAVAARDPEGR